MAVSADSDEVRDANDAVMVDESHDASTSVAENITSETGPAESSLQDTKPDGAVLQPWWSGLGFPKEVMKGRVQDNMPTFGQFSKGE